MSKKYEKTLPQPNLIRIVDFFCGCGGMSWGFKQTRQSHNAYQILAGIDNDPRALKTYDANIGAKSLNIDIGKLAKNPSKLLEEVPELSDKNDPLVFIGCAPCQGFSAHRKKDSRDDHRNDLMHAFALICKHYLPDFIVMENVPEILNGRFSDYYSKARKVLESSGYLLSEDILDLSLYGVPQRRKRAIIIASRASRTPLPKPVFTLETAPTVRDAIAHLEPINSGETDKDDPFHRAPAHIPRILEKIKKIPADGGDRRALPETEQLSCHANVDSGTSPGFTDVYGRLRWDEPSVTITAKSSTPSCGRFLHPEQHRNISVREAAILQGFPQSFIFEGPFTNQYRQIGEAVPPLFARFLAKSILDKISKPEKTFVFEQRPLSEILQQDVYVIDAFCGAGGIALGFKEAGYKTAFAFDLDEFAVKTFNHNVQSCAEVLDVRAKETTDKISAAIKNKAYIIVGGPPCQGFSQQRRGAHVDPRNNLILAYLELIKSLPHRPLGVVLENVTYLDSPRGKDILARFVEGLEKIGYAVKRLDLNSADYAVPQLRHRIVLVALKSQYAAYFEGPTPVTDRVWPTIGEVLWDLTHSNWKFSGLPNHQPSKEGALNVRRISYVDMGSGRMSIPEDLQLPCHIRYGGHLDVYGRLDWFAQARTITVGFDSFTRGEFAHPFFNRSITHREAARIQGFPDTHEFFGNRSDVRKQIGNAVPPPMAYAIAESIKKAIHINSNQTFSEAVSVAS